MDMKLHLELSKEHSFHLLSSPSGRFSKVPVLFGSLTPIPSTSLPMLSNGRPTRGLELRVFPPLPLLHLASWAPGASGPPVPVPCSFEEKGQMLVFRALPIAPSQHITTIPTYLDLSVRFGCNIGRASDQIRFQSRHAFFRLRFG